MQNQKKVNLIENVLSRKFSVNDAQQPEFEQDEDRTQMYAATVVSKNQN